MIDEWTTLRRIRADVKALCDTADSLMQPQYRHLLARVEAVIEVAAFEHGELDGREPRSGPPAEGGTVARI